MSGYKMNIKLIVTALAMVAACLSPPAAAESSVSFMDMVPGIAQIKSLVQLVAGDPDGALKTQNNYINEGIGPSQLRSAYYLVTGDPAKAGETQKSFLNNLEPLVDGLPIFGHAKGVYHLIDGDTDHGWRAIKSSTATTATVVGAVAGGPAGAVGAHVAADLALSAFGEPHGVVNYVSNIGNHDAGGHFDAVTGLVLDAAGGKVASSRPKMSIARVTDNISLTRRGETVPSKPPSPSAPSMSSGSGRAPSPSAAPSSSSSNGSPVPSHKSLTPSNGSPSPSNGSPPPPNGLPPPSNGSPSPSHRSSSPSNGSPSTSNGSPPPPNGSPPPSNGSPSPSHRSPSPSNGSPSTSNGSPTPSNGSPPPFNGSPPPSNESPLPSNGLPSPSHRSPSPSNGSPPQSDRSPSPSNGSPSPSNGSPTSSRVSSVPSNGLPPAPQSSPMLSRDTGAQSQNSEALSQGSPPLFQGSPQPSQGSPTPSQGSLTPFREIPLTSALSNALTDRPRKVRYDRYMRDDSELLAIDQQSRWTKNSVDDLQIYSMDRVVQNLRTEPITAKLRYLTGDEKALIRNAEYRWTNSAPAQTNSMMNSLAGVLETDVVTLTKRLDGLPATDTLAAQAEASATRLLDECRTRGMLQYRQSGRLQNMIELNSYLMVNNHWLTGLRFVLRETVNGQPGRSIVVKYNINKEMYLSKVFVDFQEPPFLKPEFPNPKRFLNHLEDKENIYYALYIIEISKT